MNARNILLASAALALAGIGLAPVLVILAKSLLFEGPAGLSYYQRMWESNRVWILLGHSAAVSGLTTLLTLAAGLMPLVFAQRAD
ncbi:MAG: hypothetical protein Q8N47_07580 [Bryobacterales bacterium]|nr:hypothetical protein [Bryobacterales bacterium]